MKRIWEIDFLRGLALIIMVYYHIIFDLNEIFNIKVSYESGMNYFVGKLSAILFIALSGLSSSLSKSNVKRGIKVLAIALILTIVTSIFTSFSIKFGILHLLGVSMIIYPLLNKIKTFHLSVLGLVIIIIPYAVSMKTNFDWLFMLGFYSEKFYSGDYYPLIPWLGIFIFGIVFGRIFYSEKRSLLIKPLRDNIVNAVGRNTLIIYLIHQPLIFAIIYLSIKFLKEV